MPGAGGKNPEIGVDLGIVTFATTLSGSRLPTMAEEVVEALRPAEKKLT
ncbi:MAG: hypothetical protein VST70_07840 [Nitrospirota bacterium]|nr:hypothetical protein [Nitrospirota bacterium]